MLVGGFRLLFRRQRRVTAG